MLQINLFDVAVVLFLLFFTGRGLVRGLTREITGVVGVVGGLALARHFQHKVQPSMEPLFSDPDIAGIAAFALILIVALAMTSLLAAGLRKVMNTTMTSWVDHVLGGLGGLAKGVLLACLLFFMLQGFFPDLAVVREAKTTPLLHDMLDYLRNFLPAAFTYKFPSFKL